MQATTVTSGAALAASATNLMEISNVNGPALVRVSIPNFTALAAAETVSLTLVRLDTGAVIGGAVLTNPGAGASGAGPLVAEALVPVGQGYTVAAQLSASVATGSYVASATTPAIMSVLP